MTSSPGEPTPASNLTLEELLRQHDVIRDLCARCDELVEAVEQTPSQIAPVGQLVSAVARLRWAVSTHNRLEEQMLSPMLQSAPAAEPGARAEAGATGPHAGCCAVAASPPLEQRVAAHRAEHHDLGLRLERLNLDSLRETLRILREHLEDEECHFLAPRPPRERRRARATTARP
jgi:Hemerythrin HHE cation binding domain